jgi:hypothetical protein
MRVRVIGSVVVAIDFPDVPKEWSTEKYIADEHPACAP